MNKITPNIIQQAISYQEYHDWMATLVTHSTTEDYNEEMINYTRMNIIRMERLDKTTRISEAIKDQIEAITKPYYCLTLTEPWCGDAAQILPILNKLNTLNEHFQLGLIMRDKHLEIMDAFLTDGARSIPKIIILDPESLEVLGTWGPRPYVAHGLMMKGLKEYRAMEEGEAKELFKRDLYTKLQKWYARDKTTSTQEEFMEAFQKAIT